MSVKNVVDLMCLAEKHNAVELKSQAMKFMVENKTKICMQPEINHLSKETIIELLKHISK